MSKSEILRYFEGKPKTLEVFTAIEEQLAALGPSGCSVQKQISFAVDRKFAWVWLYNVTKADPNGVLHLMLAIDHEVPDAHVRNVAQVGKARWNHQIVVRTERDARSKWLGALLRQAYAYGGEDEHAVSGQGHHVGVPPKDTAKRPAKAAKKSAANKSVAKKKAPAKAAPAKRAKPVLLSGDNPQIAKGEGDAPVKAFLAAIPGWKRAVARQLDALIVQAVPDVHKAVKWNSPMYGIEGEGRFLAMHCYTNYVQVSFFRGTSLRPVPPGPSKTPETRYLNVRQDEPLDEAQFVDWVKQASELPGEKL